SRSQTHIASSPAAASRFPSGLKATLKTLPVGLFRGRISRPRLTSHSFTVLSRLPDASRFPSGLKAMLRTGAVCPFKIKRNRPLAWSHILILQSPPPEASCFPSGLNATHLEASLRIIDVSP